MKLTEIYAAVIAKRPDLAVRGLSAPVAFHPDWMLPISRVDDTPGDRIAAAMILARWVEALPELVCIHRRSYGWIVGSGGSAHTCPPPLIAPTPIEALAAFYLGANPEAEGRAGTIHVGTPMYKLPNGLLTTTPTDKFAGYAVAPKDGEVDS